MGRKRRRINSAHECQRRSTLEGQAPSSPKRGVRGKKIQRGRTVREKTFTRVSTKEHEEGLPKRKKLKKDELLTVCRKARRALKDSATFVRWGRVASASKREVGKRGGKKKGGATVRARGGKIYPNSGARGGKVPSCQTEERGNRRKRPSENFSVQRIF